jgi:hypothetical protein
MDELIRMVLRGGAYFLAGLGSLSIGILIYSRVKGCTFVEAFKKFNKEMSRVRGTHLGRWVR